MSTESEPSPSPSTRPAVVVAHHREPGTFCGIDDVDADDWLALYERVSTHNRWDPTLMLANVIFYLTGTARVWFETHEDDLTSWDICKQKLRDLFGKPIGRQLAAKKALASRAQTSSEPYIAYIQDVLALCRKVDKEMSEADRVGHILKGIADDAFNLLLCKDCSTVASVLEVCRRFEQAKHRRISHSFDRLPNTAASSSCDDLPTLRQPSDPANLTRIVRRELEAMTPAVSSLPLPDNTLALIQAVVRQEVANLAVPSRVVDNAHASPDPPSFNDGRQEDALSVPEQFTSSPGVKNEMVQNERRHITSGSSRERSSLRIPCQVINGNNDLAVASGGVRQKAI
ncbi:uncharacterized protein LOC144098119 [Amblyomma americanum]